MPLSFGIAHLAFTNPQVSLFAAFGSFALMLFVDFRGRPRTRLASFGALLVGGSVFIVIGTVASTHGVAAVVAMAVVGFATLFAGILSPTAAAATTAALLTFVLPVAVSAPASAIGPRLAGWAIAAALAIPSCLLVWPAPWHDDLRRRLSAVMSVVAEMAVARAAGHPDPEAEAAVTTELARLRAQFEATPYPPYGAVGSAIALAKLVGRVEWVADIALLTDDPSGSHDPAAVRRVVEAIAVTLRRSAQLVCDGQGRPVEDRSVVASVQQATIELEREMDVALHAELTALAAPAPDAGSPDGGSPDNEAQDADDPLNFDPSFRARTCGIATEMVADSVLEAAGAQAVGDRRLGPIAEPLPRLAWSRFTSHLSFRSVWFRNSIRGAAGLALAVAVVEITDVEHGFWVILGTLSVLRSNALGTGATAARAIAGTAVGFVIGAAIMVGVGGHTGWLWAILPLAVLVSGAAPSMISFAAGQAGFTVTVVVLFNIIDPTGWRVGLTRIEDVAIGCAVSVVVGLLFWPRGATAELGRALSRAFATSSGYLAEAVDHLTVSSRQVDTSTAQREAHRAYLQLDDALRQYLVERGAKDVPVGTVARLATGSNRIRLAAFTLASLPVVPVDPDHPELESVAVAGAVLRDSYAASHRWYQGFATVLADRHGAPDPPPGHDATLDHVLRQAFLDARLHHRPDRLRVMLRLLWADELLENQERFQVDLVTSAGLFVRSRRGDHLPSPGDAGA